MALLCNGSQQRFKEEKPHNRLWDLEKTETTGNMVVSGCYIWIFYFQRTKVSKTTSFLAT